MTNIWSVYISLITFSVSIGAPVQRVDLFDANLVRKDFKAYVSDGQPAVFPGAASNWGVIRSDGMKALLRHFDPKTTFFFDIAPESWNLLNHGNFTFAPSYNGHGYALEDICRAVLGGESDSDLDLNTAQSTEIFLEKCHGSPYTTKRMSMPSFLAHQGPPLFAKLGPANLPKSLQDQLQPDNAFLLNPDDPRDMDLWIGSKGWRSATHYDLQHNAYVQVSMHLSLVR